MQKTVILLIAIALTFSTLTFAQKPVNIITWNLRYDNPGDNENAWGNRKTDVVKLISFFKADFVCTQEGLSHQVKYLNDSLVNFGYVGVGRDDGKEKGEYCAIFYNKSRFEIKQQETFWLSETPQSPTKGWDAAIVRICTWIKVSELKTKKQFYVFNTHFDHMGVVAREKSAELILKKIKEINKEKLSVVLCGDFNATDVEKPYEVMTRELIDARKISQIPAFGPMATFNGFKHEEVPTDRIDYIFVNKMIKAERYGVITSSKNNRYPSDHFPVFAELMIP